MFYQEALPKFQFLSRVDSLLTIGDRHWRKVAATFEKAESANSLSFVVPVHVGAYFYMGVYKHNVVVVIKMGAYIHGVLILCGCLLFRFYGSVLDKTNTMSNTFAARNTVLTDQNFCQCQMLFHLSNLYILPKQFSQVPKVYIHSPDSFSSQVALMVLR